MAITVVGCSGNKYIFEGPYDNTGSLKDNSGDYLVVCYDGTNYYPVDVGESAKVKTRIENHDRTDCWKRNCNNKLMVAVLYTPSKQQAGRKAIEQDIRCAYNFPCGDR